MPKLEILANAEMKGDNKLSPCKCRIKETTNQFFAFLKSSLFQISLSMKYATSYLSSKNNYCFFKWTFSLKRMSTFDTEDSLEKSQSSPFSLYLGYITEFHSHKVQNVFKSIRVLDDSDEKKKQKKCGGTSFIFYYGCFVSTMMRDQLIVRLNVQILPESSI